MDGMHSASGITTVNFPTLLHFSFANAPTGALAALLLLFAFVAWFDLRSGRIPDWVVGAGFAGATLVGVTGGTPAHTVVLATLVGFGVPLSARWVTNGRLGWGDVKLSLVLALFVGPTRAAAGLLLASLLALSCTIGRRCEAGVAFGPYLVAGMVIVLALERVYGL